MFYVATKERDAIEGGGGRQMESRDRHAEGFHLASTQDGCLRIFNRPSVAGAVL